MGDEAPAGRPGDTFVTRVTAEALLRRKDAVGRGLVDVLAGIEPLLVPADGGRARGH